MTAMRTESAIVWALTSAALVKAANVSMPADQIVPAPEACVTPMAVGFVSVRPRDVVMIAPVLRAKSARPVRVSPTARQPAARALVNVML